jgi:NTP pyrophosphatase (non-canonical NTP hydrolase)
VTTLRELNDLLDLFYERRDWRRFQTPKDVAASLAVEAAELQEFFLWLDERGQVDALASRHSEVASELADILINCLNMATLAGVDLAQAVHDKVIALDQKYPVEQVRGKVIAHR